MQAEAFPSCGLTGKCSTISERQFHTRLYVAIVRTQIYSWFKKRKNLTGFNKMKEQAPWHQPWSQHTLPLKVADPLPSMAVFPGLGAGVTEGAPTRDQGAEQTNTTLPGRPVQFIIARTRSVRMTNEN